MSREAMKLALEALEKADSRDGYLTYITEIEALREALAEQPAQQQEPVAKVIGRSKLENESVSLTPRIVAIDQTLQVGTMLYTSPPAQRTLVGLTDEQILAANYPDGEENGPTIAAPDFELICFARQIEAKLREKNT